jgi:hypothetical protein
MQTVLRSRFPDTLLEPELLESAAALWLEWSLQAHIVRLLPQQSFHRVQAHLWGVPRPDIEQCRARLARRVAQDLPDAAVELSDADTLTVTSPWREGPQPAALARVAGVFGGECEGMRLMLRFTAGQWRGTPDDRPHAEGTLVLWTELRGGVPRLRGTWPGDLSGNGETPFQYSPWAGESGFWEDVGRFRETDEAPPCRERLFITPARQRLRRAARWLQVDVGEQRTLGAFLVRAVTFGIIAAASLTAVCIIRTVPVILLTAPLGLVSLRLFLQTLIKKAMNVVNLHHNMKTRLREVYSQPLHYVPVNLAEAGPWPEVSAAKYTREAEHLGFVHWRDIHRDASRDKVAGGSSFYRLFALPSQRTYLFLSLMHSTRLHRQFPVKAWFMSFTYFGDGTRLLLTNEHGGYSRTRDRLAIQRFFPEAGDVAELIELRRPIVQRLIAEGKELAPIMTAGELIARLEADHLRIAEFARRAGYFTWGAAVLQSFQLTRREFRSRT